MVILCTFNKIRSGRASTSITGLSTFCHRQVHVQGLSVSTALVDTLLVSTVLVDIFKVSAALEQGLSTRTKSGQVRRRRQGVEKGFRRRQIVKKDLSTSTKC